MAVTFTPASLDFGTRPLNQPRVLTVVAKTKDAVTFTVTDAQGNPATGRFVVSPASIAAESSEKEVTLQVTFTPSATGTYGATLTASTGGTLALAGVCANLTIEQSPLAFGEQAVGSSTIRSVLVSNYGATAATLSVSQGSFTIVDAAGNPSADLSVPAGQAKVVLVKFTPPSAGDKTGTLTATRGAGAGNTATAALTGTGSAVQLTAGEVGGDLGLIPTRLHIEVPTTETALTMGRAINNLSYDGCGLTTKGDIFLNAIGDTSHFWAQSRADMVLQSFENNIFMLAGNGWTTAAVGGASLLGGGGVTIAAGFKDSPVVATADAAQPPDTGAADTLAKSVAKAAVAAGVIDAALAFGLGIRGLYGVGSALYKAYDADRLGETLANKWGVTIMGVLGGLGGLVAGVVGSWGTHATNTGGSSPFAGVSIFGAGGVVVGTPAFCSIYGLAGVVVGSMYPIIYGGDAEMMGMRSATVSGYRNAVLQSHSKTTVHSDGDIEISADGGGGGGIPFINKIPGAKDLLSVGKSKRGRVNVAAPHIVIGRDKQLFMDLTRDIVGRAQNIDLAAHTEARLTLRAVEGAATLQAQTRAELRVRRYTMEMLATGIQLGKSAGPAVGGAPVDPLILVEDDGIALSKGNNNVVVADDQVVVGNPNGAFIQCKANNQLVLKGQRVLLG